MLAAVLAVAALSGCSLPMQTHEPSSAAGKELMEAAPQVLDFSLFKSDKDVISDADIKRILESELRLPKQARIAVLKLPSKHASYYWWSEAYLKMQQEYVDVVSGKLSGSGRVGKVTVLPSLITPRDASVSILREAAVRLQADMLLVFQITSDIYREYKLFRKDRAKAYSTCEAVLLDVRTGLIPFASVATREHLELQEKSDMKMQEDNAAGREGGRQEVPQRDR